MNNSSHSQWPDELPSPPFVPASLPTRRPSRRPTHRAHPSFSEPPELVLQLPVEEPQPNDVGTTETPQQTVDHDPLLALCHSYNVVKTYPIRPHKLTITYDLITLPNMNPQPTHVLAVHDTPLSDPNTQIHLVPVDLNLMSQKFRLGDYLNFPPSSSSSTASPHSPTFSSSTPGPSSLSPLGHTYDSSFSSTSRPSTPTSPSSSATPSSASFPSPLTLPLPPSPSSTGATTPRRSSAYILTLPVLTLSVPHAPSLPLLLLFALGFRNDPSLLAAHLVPLAAIEEFPSAVAMAQVMASCCDSARLGRYTRHNQGAWKNVLALGMGDERLCRVVQTVWNVTAEARRIWGMERMGRRMDLTP
ncbi:uncharacterized protein STEHIDRAFT_130811 [Stereum hirsutum FP-91666 SS1]|uniref:uncharacterized protein n=1 Tax=Stereum hirsutum (strain FP-91666) TaxID=721885 RepID=UPI000441042D|nr:uncharacterized protein STEHIDRAFT_130811 [Stereum hirsutum FP-91666 SS1]EIM87443.1 hypothetical protein STEHIDRAFT_130811 [Stereum hirsutum FP-91666 SS1]